MQIILLFACFTVSLWDIAGIFYGPLKHVSAGGRVDIAVPQILTVLFCKPFKTQLNHKDTNLKDLNVIGHIQSFWITIDFRGVQSRMSLIQSTFFYLILLYRKQLYFTALIFQDFMVSLSFLPKV